MQNTTPKLSSKASAGQLLGLLFNHTHGEKERKRENRMNSKIGKKKKKMDSTSSNAGGGRHPSCALIISSISHVPLIYRKGGKLKTLAIEREMASHMHSSKKASAFIVIAITIVGFVLRASSAVAAVDGGSPNRGDLVLAACSHTLYFDICVSSLRSDPRTDAMVDLAGLAAVTLDQSIAHGERSVSVIVDTLRTNVSSGDDQSLLRCLSDCNEEYKDAVASLKESTRAIKEREFDVVNSLVSAAMMDASTCEDGLKEMAIYDSPLSERNERFFKLCSNFLAISRLLI
ncbi:hypothetical protein BT93_D1527 [Corymbia citriodora subsp. variegata]|nr:hypothetical protein BT93_D1527 [Corymbia citriodora subsp. variegata]